MKTYMKAYYQTHREEMKSKSKANYWANPEKSSTRSKARHLTHREEDNARSKARHLTHREEDNAKRKVCHLVHREEDNAKSKVRYWANPEESRAKQKAWCQANPDAHRIIAARTHAKRRELRTDCVLNEPFSDSHLHHLTKSICLFVPIELHQSISHNIWTGHGMDAINRAVCLWLYEIGSHLVNDGLLTEYNST